VGADEVAALPDALARQPHRLVVVAPDELGEGGDAVIDCAATSPEHALARCCRLQLTAEKPLANVTRIFYNSLFSTDAS
jgi:hypothetical protein